MDIDAHLKNRTFEDAVVPVLVEMGIMILDPVPCFTINTPALGVVLTPFGEEGPYFRDTNHLSFYGAMKVKPCLEPFFDSCFGKSK